MINPRTQIRAELYIHAAKEAVWHKYTQLRDWPTWQPNVSAAEWQTGDSWQEDAYFVIRDAQGQAIRYLIRMVAPGSVTVWETMNPALTAVYSLHCTDQLGGCKVTISCTYHGLAALTIWLYRGRRQQQLKAQLEALKRYFDRK